MNGTEVLVATIVWAAVALGAFGALLMQPLPRLWLGLHVLFVAVCAASIATVITHWRSAR